MMFGTVKTIAGALSERCHNTAPVLPLPVQVIVTLSPRHPGEYNGDV